MTVDISWTYQFKDGEYPEWTLVVVTEGMKGLLRTAAAQNLSIDPESLRIQAHTRQQIKKSTGRRVVAAAELRISAEAEEIDRSIGLPKVPTGEETFNMDTPATMGTMVASGGWCAPTETNYDFTTPGIAGRDLGDWPEDDEEWDEDRPRQEAEDPVQRECMIHQEPLGWCCDGTGA